MRLIIFMTALSLFSCGQNDAGKKKDPAKDTATKIADTTTVKPVEKVSSADYTVPGEAAFNAALAVKYGTKWHVLNDKEAKWMKDAFDYFIVSKRKDFPDYPYITKGDFNGDGKQDQAAVVTDSVKSSFQIAVLLGPDNIKLWDEDILIDAALSTIPPSTIDAMDGEKTKKIKLKSDAINVEYFEKAAFVLYWDKSSFKRAQTGD